MVKHGYKQTEIGVIPEDWDVRKIGDFTDATAGGTPSTSHPEYWNGEILWMSSGELNNRRIHNVVGRITELGYNNSSTHLIPANCVLIGLAGQGKTRGTVAVNYVELCTNQSIAAIFPSKEHNSEYLYQNLWSRYEELRELSSGDGGRGGLNLAIIKNFPCAFPRLQEQNRIAEALSDVDRMISSLEKLIAKKKAVKQGAMQELLTGKKRLPGFAGEWRESTLGDLCYLITKQTGFDYTNEIKPSLVDNNSNNTLPFIQNKDFEGKSVNVKSIDWDMITEEELKNILLRYDDSSVLQFFQDALLSLINEDLKPKNSIINQGEDKYEELSAGFNSKIYFDLLSYETQRDGIYIIDQPEDNVSQKSIREYLLERFKTMGENRQVIMVTHNPQFIVNLDVDNLIFLAKNNGTLEVQSGALEYVCPEYSVLDIVAQNIDGGLESIKKRWKRYEKTIEI